MIWPFTKIREQRERIEQLEVQLAGCAVAALGGLGERALEATPGMYGWSASYGDVVYLRRRFEMAQAMAVKLIQLVRDTNQCEDADVGYACDRLADSVGMSREELRVVGEYARG